MTIGQHHPNRGRDIDLDVHALYTVDAEYAIPLVLSAAREYLNVLASPAISRGHPRVCVRAYSPQSIGSFEASFLLACFPTNDVHHPGAHD